jgi:hypothetical protein
MHLATTSGLASHVQWPEAGGEPVPIYLSDGNALVGRRTLGGIPHQCNVRIKALRRLGAVDSLADQHVIPRTYARLHDVRYIGDHPLMDAWPLRWLFEI